MSVDYHGGWMPYEDRTFSQQVMSDSFKHDTPTFGEIVGEVDLPKHALLYELEKRATGKMLNRIWQMEGSCVGAGGARAYMQSMCGDICHRKTQEEVKDLFPWTTWGVGRRIGGMNRRGAGSFGAAQAKACQEFGMTEAADSRLPQPKNRDGWLVWSAQIELDYSVPSRWPVPEPELKSTAKKVGYVLRITSWNELLQAFAQGRGVTCASMFGTSPRVTNGFLVGEWNKSWAHQMSWAGYYEHDQLGPLVAVDNQWGPQAHPECPFLSQMGVRGSFWITKATVIKILSKSSAEVFAHGDTEDWPTRKIDWDAQGMG